MQNLILRHIYKKSFFSFSEPLCLGLHLMFVKSANMTKKNFLQKGNMISKNPEFDIETVEKLS
jgi:hypothetical protein